MWMCLKLPVLAFMCMRAYCLSIHFVRTCCVGLLWRSLPYGELECVVMVAAFLCHILADSSCSVSVTVCSITLSGVGTPPGEYRW